MLLNTLKRRWPIALLVAVVIAAIVGGALYFNAQIRQPEIAAPVETQAQQTEIGQAVNLLSKPGTQFSSMLAPGTKAWWKVLNGFVPQWKLADSWDELGSAKPQSLALAIYNGGYNNPEAVFATPALFMQYSDSGKAQAAYKLFSTGKLAHDDYHSFVNGRTLVTIPVTAYSDTDFRNATKKLQLNDAAAPTKGYWSVNADVLGKYLQKVQGTKNNAFYIKAVKALGFDTTQQNVSWYGSSTDGENWRGQMTIKGDKNKDAWHQVQAKVFFTLLQQSVERIGYQAPGQPEFDPTNPGKNTGGSYFIIKPNQSLVGNYFVISNDGSTEGQLVNTQATKRLEVPAAKGNSVTYTLNPNAWFSFMMEPDQSAVFPLFSYNSATLTFNKKDPSLLNIRISE